MSEPVIVLYKLTKSYGKRRGIDGVTFSVNAGEIFGFIGPNGAGKSTTIRTLMGLLNPTGGHASVFGLDCSQNAAEIARNVGYLPSENCYYNDLKVKDTLGNKKKVGIVSALLPAPKLLIMDEPTSGLDPLIQQTFYDILRKENKRGMTIFLSSHVLSEVQKLCDRVAILREGKLVSVQSMDALRENGYKKISLTASEAIADNFFSIPGVANLERGQDKNSVSFMFNGSAMTIMDKLHQLQLEDILIEEPSLEEIFLHYYE